MSAGIIEIEIYEELVKELEAQKKKISIKIEEISIDLEQPYKNVLNKLVPQTKVVAEIFYVIKQVDY